MEYKEIYERFNMNISEGKKKKKCGVGSPYHDENGRFSSKKDAKSWSDGYEDSNRTDCTGGKWRTDGTGKKFITKHSCGRSKNGGKEKYKCKNGERVYQEGQIEEDHITGFDGEVIAPDLKRIETGDLIEEVLRRIDEGNMTTNQILSICSKINLSSKGQFPKTK
jgi:hypothetical protein